MEIVQIEPGRCGCERVKFVYPGHESTSVNHREDCPDRQAEKKKAKKK